MNAILIKAKDEISPVLIGDDTLHGMQELVGGYIEIVRPAHLRRPYVMIVNEDGINLGLPINNTGSLLYGGPIVGDVLILQEGFNEDGEPDLLSLGADEAHNLLDELVRRFPYLDIPA